MGSTQTWGVSLSVAAVTAVTLCCENTCIKYFAFIQPWGICLELAQVGSEWELLSPRVKIQFVRFGHTLVKLDSSSWTGLGASEELGAERTGGIERGDRDEFSPHDFNVHQCCAGQRHSLLFIFFSLCSSSKSDWYEHTNSLKLWILC